MRQAVTTMIVSLSLALILSGPSRGDETDVPATIDRARRLIQANDHSSAIAFLEEALVEAQAKDRSAILDLLRQSYDVMTRQADASGRSRDAAHYRDNLAILNRGRESPPPPKTSAALPKTLLEPPNTPARPKSVPKGSNAPGEVVNEPPRFLPIKALVSDLASQIAPSIKPEPAPRSEPLDIQTEKPSPPERSSSGMTAGAVSPSTESQPGPETAVSSQSDPTNISLEQADRLFAAKSYDEAGRSYAALARQNRLPANRKEHWAYCRWVEIVRRINARPNTSRDWEEIESEVRSIQQLTPKSWYGEYLRNKVAEARRSSPRAAAQSGNLVVRGSAPDEVEPRKFPRLLGKSRAAAPSQSSGTSSVPAAAVDQSLNLAGATSPSQKPNASTGVEGKDADSVAPKLASRSQPALDANIRRAVDETATAGPWQVHETANFRIFHRDARLAEAAAEAAESVRASQAKRWSSPSAERTWTPRCEIYLYPSGAMLAQATGQPDTSPGFSAMEVNGNRIVARKIHLRADHTQMRDAILPHEVTHVVVADLFIAQPLPRWADEGIAVLAEPSSEQQLKAAELREPLESGRVFALDKLMAMDYPDAKDWGIYYAQSVSLTRFLTEQGPPESFVRFVRASQQKGVEVALRDVYQIGGLKMLQQRWLEYARRQLATQGTATVDANASP